MVGAALAAIVGLDLFLVESLASRIGHTTARQTDGPQAPNVSISDLMAAALTKQDICLWAAREELIVKK